MICNEAYHHQDDKFTIKYNRVGNFNNYFHNKPKQRFTFYI